MNKEKPCGLDYCPQEEIVGAYASCMACAWGNDSDDESEEEMKGASNGENTCHNNYNSSDNSMLSLE